MLTTLVHLELTSTRARAVRPHAAAPTLRTTPSTTTRHHSHPVPAPRTSGTPPGKCDAYWRRARMGKARTSPRSTTLSGHAQVGARLPVAACPALKRCVWTRSSGACGCSSRGACGRSSRGACGRSSPSTRRGTACSTRSWCARPPGRGARGWGADGEREVLRIGWTSGRAIVIMGVSRCGTGLRSFRRVCLCTVGSSGSRRWSGHEFVWSCNCTNGIDKELVLDKSVTWGKLGRDSGACRSCARRSPRSSTSSRSSTRPHAVRPPPPSAPHPVRRLKWHHNHSVPAPFARMGRLLDIAR
ncbi:hypothetical protein PLICRDRAFT_474992 [Plicaturopsis crispa FD-325 SS-3]|nr:hypothetical protein PLICRDRAFT_474992 [Plicaturopsis crispa FD-325 SS-3]